MTSSCSPQTHPNFFKNAALSFIIQFCHHMTKSSLLSIISFFLFFVSVPSALRHFSDSILEYLANLDKAPDPTVRKDTFSSEICAAFDILFNSWLQSRESKVRVQCSCVVGIKLFKIEYG